MHPDFCRFLWSGDYPIYTKWILKSQKYHKHITDALMPNHRYCYDLILNIKL
jgi:hypothetical protein